MKPDHVMACHQQDGSGACDHGHLINVSDPPTPPSRKIFF